jgi:hypothetical protein
MESQTLSNIYESISCFIIIKTYITLYKYALKKHNGTESDLRAKYKLEITNYIDELQNEDYKLHKINELCSYIHGQIKPQISHDEIIKHILTIFLPPRINISTLTKSDQRRCIIIIMKISVEGLARFLNDNFKDYITSVDREDTNNCARIKTEMMRILSFVKGRIEFEFVKESNVNKPILNVPDQIRDKIREYMYSKCAEIQRLEEDLHAYHETITELTNKNNLLMESIKNYQNKMAASIDTTKQNEDKEALRSKSIALTKLTNENADLKQQIKKLQIELDSLKHIAEIHKESSTDESDSDDTSDHVDVQTDDTNVQTDTTNTKTDNITSLFDIQSTDDNHTQSEERDTLLDLLKPK